MYHCEYCSCVKFLPISHILHYKNRGRTFASFSHLESNNLTEVTIRSEVDCYFIICSYDIMYPLSGGMYSNNVLQSRGSRGSELHVSWVSYNDYRSGTFMYGDCLLEKTNNIIKHNLVLQLSIIFFYCIDNYSILCSIKFIKVLYTVHWRKSESITLLLGNDM